MLKKYVFQKSEVWFQSISFCVTRIFLFILTGGQKTVSETHIVKTLRCLKFVWYCSNKRNLAVRLQSTITSIYNFKIFVININCCCVIQYHQKVCQEWGYGRNLLKLLVYESIERNNRPGKKVNKISEDDCLLTFPSYELDNSILNLYPL